VKTSPSVGDEHTDDQGVRYYGVAKTAKRLGVQLQTIKARTKKPPKGSHPREIDGEWFFPASEVEAERSRRLEALGAVEPDTASQPPGPPLDALSGGAAGGSASLIVRVVELEEQVRLLKAGLGSALLASQHLRAADQAHADALGQLIVPDVSAT
jgi:hypothetical protein